jgi:hypothetical protein
MRTYAAFENEDRGHGLVRRPQPPCMCMCFHVYLHLSGSHQCKDLKHQRMADESASLSEPMCMRACMCASKNGLRAADKAETSHGQTPWCVHAYNCHKCVTIILRGVVTLALAGFDHQMRQAEPGSCQETRGAARGKRHGIPRRQDTGKAWRLRMPAPLSANACPKINIYLYVYTHIYIYIRNVHISKHGAAYMRRLPYGAHTIMCGYATCRSSVCSARGI